MALVKCAECGTDVATSAASCPKCGAPGPAVAAMQQRHKRLKPHLLGAVITLGLGMVGWMVMLTNREMSESLSIVVVVLVMGGSLWGLVTVLRIMRPHS